MPLAPPMLSEGQKPLKQREKEGCEEADRRVEEVREMLQYEDTMPPTDVDEQDTSTPPPLMNLSGGFKPIMQQQRFRLRLTKARKTPEYRKKRRTMQKVSRRINRGV